MSGTTDTPADHLSTIEVARRLGLAVRSVQLMVDRGELDAWKTPGGHRRIAGASVDRWLAERSGGQKAPGRKPGPAAHALDSAGDARPVPPPGTGGTGAAAGVRPVRVLLIEDSRHYQNLVSLLVRQRFPGVELHVADEGIAGLALAGRLEPDVLLVDLLLPGIDGATLITGLRSHAAFESMKLIVITSLEGSELGPYAFALQGVPVVHKPKLVTELPRLLEAALAARAS